MRQPPRIRLYVSRWCAQCERAVVLLERHGLEFEAIEGGGDPDGCCRLHEPTEGRSVPQAVVDGRPIIGGYDELDAWLRTLALQPRGPRVRTSP